MPLRYQAVTVKPSQGGRLITNLSADEAGLYNYTVKRDWRRDLDQEMRREGHGYFWPNFTDQFASNPGNQPFPNNLTLTTLTSLAFRETLGPDMGLTGTYGSPATKTITTEIGERYYWTKGTYDLSLNNNGTVLSSNGYFVAGADTVVITGTVGQAIGFHLYPVEWYLLATVNAGHMFVDGERITIDSNNASFDGSFTVYGVTRTTFRVPVSVIISTFSTTQTAISIEPLNLVHLARRPNGKTAVIVGTKTRLFRFFALENGAYFEGNGTSDSYFQESPYANTPYYEDNPGEWIIIGNGFSTSGNRWEAVAINGWSVFNNGVDLPHTYRVEDLEAFPIYEMREQGITAVGTIAEFNGILMCGDISEIQDEKYDDLFRPLGTLESGDILASQASNTVTAQSAIFGQKVTSITRSGTTATVTTPAPHGYQTGQNVTIAGASPVAYNGSQTVTVVSPRVFTFTVGGSPATPATGTISATDVVGRYITWDVTGTSVRITSYTSTTVVTVAGSAATITNERFTIRTQAAEVGSYFSGSITGTLNHTTMVVTFSSAPTIGGAGQILRFSNGFSSVITLVTDPTHVTLTLADDPGVDFTVGMPFWLVDDPVDYRVVATAPIFTSDYVGRLLTWDSGDVRRIESVVSPTIVVVDSDLPIVSGFVGIENLGTYGAYTDLQYVDRIQYRIAWSAVGEPRRWSSAVPVSIAEGSNRITLAYPFKSFESGQEVTIVGAGINGGNLTSTLLYIQGNQFGIIDTVAQATVTDGLMQQTESIGSISAAADLQDDGSGILKMLQLQNVLVIYKDTTIFLGTYTGLVENPFDFQRRAIDPAKSLYFRYTLSAVEAETGSFHVFAGKNHFLKFDLTTQRPQISEAGELCKSIFFEHADLIEKNRVFAAENVLTNELCFVFENASLDASADRAMCFDLVTGTMSTTSAKFTAAASVKRPETGLSIGETEDWFVMGNANGVVLLYGKANEPVPSWGDAQEIYYRVEANPFSATKTGYTSVITDGIIDFGDANDEKDLEGYVPILSSQSPDTPIQVELLGTRNPSEGTTVLNGFPYTITSPETKNLIPVYLRENYFQSRITISGYDNPCRMSKKIWSVSGLKSNSFIRRP